MTARVTRAQCDHAVPTIVGTVSLGLHSATGSANEIASRVIDDARCAEASGFDGVTISEHHDGFPSYLPQPLLAAGWVLAATTRVWAGPLPMLLGLRNARLVVEELAWTAARHPQRLVAAMAPGYARSDFDALAVPFDDRFDRFDAALREVAAPHRPTRTGGPDVLAGDAAVRDWATNSLGLLCAVNSDAAARRAAELGIGIVFPGREDPARLARLGRVYRDAGGDGPVVAIVSVWSGAEPSTAHVDALDRVLVGAAAPGMRQRGGFRVERVVAPTSEITERVIELCDIAGVTAVNLRITSSDATAAETHEQIARIGDEVVPALRRSLTAPTNAPTAATTTPATTVPTASAAPSSTATPPTHHPA